MKRFALSLWFVASVFTLQLQEAGAAPTQEQKCEARKHVAAGVYALCRQKAQNRFVLNGNEETLGTKLGVCQENFTNAWNLAEEKAASFGATCPDEPLASQAVAGAVAQMSGNLAGALAGASLLSCTVTSRVLSTEATGCLPKGPSGALGPCPGTPAGQDGALLDGVRHSYTDNGDGTITDNETGLMWEALSANDGSIHDSYLTYTWYGAFTSKIATLNSTSFAGHNDWRLPNINELQSLYESHVYGVNFPVFNNMCGPGCTVPGCSCPGFNTWSSTSNADPAFPNSAWYFVVDAGWTATIGKAYQYGVRAVRAGGGPSQPLRTGATLCDSGSGSLGTCPGSPAGQDAALGLGAARSYTDNLDGTITDNSTGLMWEALSDDGSIHDKDTTGVWTTAFTKINALNASGFAGHSDWRLPNVNELRSLLHFRYASLAFDPVFNAGCTSGCSVLTCSCPGNTFWSSTADNQNGGGSYNFIWAVHNNGIVFNYQDFFSFGTRAVRDDF